MDEVIAATPTGKAVSDEQYFRLLCVHLPLLARRPDRTLRAGPTPHDRSHAHSPRAELPRPLAPSGSLWLPLPSPPLSHQRAAPRAASPRCSFASTRPPPSPPRWATFLRRPSQRPSSAPPCLRPRPAPPPPPPPPPPTPPPASVPPPPPPSTLPPRRRWMRCPRAAGRLACCPRPRRRRAAASRCCRLSCRWWCRLRCLRCR